MNLNEDCQSLGQSSSGLGSRICKTALVCKGVTKGTDHVVMCVYV